MLHHPFAMPDAQPTKLGGGWGPLGRITVPDEESRARGPELWIMVAGSHLFSNFCYWTLVHGAGAFNRPNKSISPSLVTRSFSPLGAAAQKAKKRKRKYFFLMTNNWQIDVQTNPRRGFEGPWGALHPWSGPGLRRTVSWKLVSQSQIQNQASRSQPGASCQDVQGSSTVFYDLALVA